MRKKGILAALLLIVGLLMSACGSSSSSSSAGGDANESSGSTGASSEETIVLKFASGLPTTHALYTEVEKVFMDRVTELTDGRVQFEHYPAEQLGKSGDLLSLTASGTADVTFYSPGYNPSEMPFSASLYAIPGLYGTSEEISPVVHKLMKEDPILENDFRRNGVLPLMTVFTPSYNIFSNDRPVKVPEDLKGLRLKAAGGVANEYLSFMGANPLTIPVSELYASMERGVVDGMHSYFQDVVVYDLEDIINYATYGLNLGGSGPGYAINEKVFNDLPGDIQEAILQAADETVISGSKAYDRINDEAMEAVKDKIEIYEVTGDELELWYDVYEEFTENWLNDLGDEYRQVYEKLRQELEVAK